MTRRAVARGVALAARMLGILGIDFHILQTLMLRGWSVVAGGVMVLFVPHWFSGVEQGFYFTFNSLIAIQIFFELGMNQIVVQLVSHEAAHLHEDVDGTIDGPRASVTRLMSLNRLLMLWYRVAALLFFVVGGAAGIIFFETQGVRAGGREIVLWMIIVLFTALNLYMSPALAMLEGFGRVGEVARVRLTQSIFGYIVMWLMLSFGAGLLAAPVLAGMAMLYTAYWLKTRDRRIRWLRSLTLQPADETLSWRRDVFPLQWRIALSWASGYLILQLLVPVAFSRQGAVEAGRLGLTLTIFNSLLSIGLSWVNARLPVMAGHLARGQFDDAKRVFRGVMARSTIITALGSASVIAAIFVMPASMRLRFADNFTIGWLALATITNCGIYAMATFTRAHKEEPLLLQSVFSALIMVPAIYIGSRYSVSVMTGLFSAVIIGFSLPAVFIIFRRYYAGRQHAQATHRRGPDIQP